MGADQKIDRPVEAAPHRTKWVVVVVIWGGGVGVGRQYHNKGYKQGNGKMLFFERNSSFPQHITSKSNTIKHGSFDSCFSISKTLISKMTVPICPLAESLKFSTCLEITYKR